MHIFHTYTPWKFAKADGSPLVTKTCKVCGKIKATTIGRLRAFDP